MCQISKVYYMRLHVGAKLPKQELARLITKIWDELYPAIITNGFKKTGIFPVDRNAISKDKFDALSWSRWETLLNCIIFISVFSPRSTCYYFTISANRIKRSWGGVYLSGEFFRRKLCNSTQVIVISDTVMGSKSIGRR